MSALEETLAFQLRAVGLPAPEREYRFSPPRRWRFDFAYPARMLAVEVDGGTWVNGRHVRGQGFQNDCDKLNAAALEGWRVLRFTRNHIRSGAALTQIERALAAETLPDGAGAQIP